MATVASDMRLTEPGTEGMARAEASAFDPRTVIAPMFETDVLCCHMEDEAPADPMVRVRHALMAFVDRLPIGMLLLAEDRSLLWANAGAREMFAARDALALDARDRCQAAGSEGRAAFAALFEAALTLGPVANPDTHCIRLPRTGRRSPLLVRAICHEGDGRRIVCLIVRDPDAPAGPSEGALRQLFGLTPAEARLAVALVKGETAVEYSKARGVSRNTVKTQVAAILDKSELRRQSELIRNLAGLF